jgi:hypothetical protein
MKRALSIILLLAACGSDKTKAPPPAPNPTPNPAPASTSGVGSALAAAAAEDPPAPTKVDPAAAGAAYLAVEGTGIVQLDGGKITTIQPQQFVSAHFAVGPGNVVYAAGIGGLFKIERKRAAKFPAPAENTSYDGLAVAPDGTLWVLEMGGVEHWNGKAWIGEPKATFGDALLGKIAVDTSGHPWISTADHLWKLDGTWSKVDTSFAGKDTPYFDAIAAGPSGEVYESSLAGTRFWKDGTWHRVQVEAESGSFSKLFIGRDGRFVASGSVDEIVVGAAGAKPHAIHLAKIGATAHRAEVLAIDGAGRTWLGSDNGVIVLGADDKLLQQWTPGTVAGITGKVTAIAVLGAGPSLPTIGSASTGTVVGKVLMKGQPVAGAAIEMCDMPLTMFEKTPCDSGITTHTATTGADGTFSVAAVPIGSYGFAVKTAGKWLIMIGGGCCTEMQAGKSYDVGSITLDR